MAGTGYSSLDHLRKIPFDKVTIDGSFVHDQDSCRRNRLLSEGCQEVQGFHFGRPMPARELRARIGAPAAAGAGPVGGACRLDACPGVGSCGWPRRK